MLRFLVCPMWDIHMPTQHYSRAFTNFSPCWLCESYSASVLTTFRTPFTSSTWPHFMLICWPAGWTAWASQRNAGSTQINKHCKPILNFSFIHLKQQRMRYASFKIIRSTIPLKAETPLSSSDCYSFQENVPGNSLAGITKLTRFVFVQIRLPFMTNSIFANHARSQATHRVERTQNWLRWETVTHAMRKSCYSWETNKDN